MDYFYVPREQIRFPTVEITGEEFNHLVHVMRKKEGDEIRIVDGCGTAYDVVLANYKKKTALGKIIACHENHGEPAIHVSIAVGILKNPSKFDFLVEKVTELGAREIIPITTERTISRHAKTARWQKLALAAMKQCSRSFLPRVTELRTLDQVLDSVPSYQVAFVCHSSDESGQGFPTHWDHRHVGSSDAGTPSVLITIGPEGGLSDNEVSASVKAGCRVVSLGPRRLRTETAAICAAALVLRL